MLLAAPLALMASPGHCPGGYYDWLTGTYICPSSVGIGSASELATLETYKNDIVDHTNQIEFANKGEDAMGIGGSIGIGKKIKWIDIVPRYNPTGNIGLDARLPLVQNSETDKFGIGDFSISGNYHFGNLNSEYGTNITTLRYKSATGDLKDGTGTGESAISLTHTLAKNIGSDLRVHGLAQFTYNMGDVENSIAIMGGLSHTELIPQTAVANVKFTYYHQDKLTVADLWMELSSSTVVPDVPLSAGLKIPIMNDLDGADPEKYFMLYATMHSFFDQ